METPKWARDGKSIFFTVVGDGVYRIPVTTEPTFTVTGEAQKIVASRVNSEQFFIDISPDDKTLAITAYSVEVDLRGGQKDYSTLMRWQNWAQSLSKD